MKTRMLVLRSKNSFATTIRGAVIGFMVCGALELMGALGVLLTSALTREHIHVGGNFIPSYIAAGAIGGLVGFSYSLFEVARHNRKRKTRPGVGVGNSQRRATATS